MLCDDAQSTENQNSGTLDGLHENQRVLTIQTKKEPVGREKVFAATYWLGNDALNTQRPPSTTATENLIIKRAVMTLRYANRQKHKGTCSTLIPAVNANQNHKEIAFDTH